MLRPAVTFREIADKPEVPLFCAQFDVKGPHNNGTKKYLSADAKIVTATFDDTVIDCRSHRPNE